MSGDPRSQRRRYEEAEIGRVLSDAETCVSTALHGYKETQDYRTWVPLPVLFILYKRWLLNHRPDMNPVGIRKFGAIVNILYPETEMVKRRYRKTKVTGRAGLDGPGALRSKFGESPEST